MVTDVKSIKRPPGWVPALTAKADAFLSTALGHRGEWRQKRRRQDTAEIGATMTVSAEHTCIYLRTHNSQRPAKPQCDPKDVRKTAKWLLRHYPELSTVEYVHKVCPSLSGPLPEHMSLLQYAPGAKPGFKNARKT